ncbi:unnamed protein product [Kluyveromyces dobzhanskii CBS 2104]|uniref:WGS project CCBQ000000000 data, contig 00106 n=1 Tax=Kluyveromyces dobzhanskii CBS 2104 TaxID=1427455 RepID=A0A0A8L7L6_9SACH|nr:unnamed protein product [Kluyveromyces dobzhanskii CBS 2104]
MSSNAGYAPNHAKPGESRALPPQQQIQMPGSGIVMQQQQQQQQQRLMYQQRLKQQQQQQLHFEQQIYQLLTTLNRKPKRFYQFKEDPDELLKKYEQFKPSFEFHIYENNFKICAPANSRLQQHQKTPQNSNDGLILNKNNEVLREFLEYVARGIIPEAIMEVLRDCNIQFYEGCLILQVYDHTNTVDVKQETPNTHQVPNNAPPQTDTQKKSATSGPSASGLGVNSPTPQVVAPVTNSPSLATGTGLAPKQEGTSSDAVPKHSTSENTAKPTANNSSTGGSDKDKENSGKLFTTLKRPRMYRTLLKPNDLTHYYDMLSYADHTRFPDSMYQQLESEILTLTKRNLNLDTPLNPYTHKECIDDDEFQEPTFAEDKQKWVFPHRELCTDSFTKGAIEHLELHEELPQHSSTYEQLMLILSEKTTTTTAATLAASLLKKAEANAAQKAATNGKNSGSSVGVTSNSVAAAAAVGTGTNTDAQQFSRLKIIEHWRIEKERRKHQSVNSNVVPSAYDTRISMGNVASPGRMSQQHPDGQQTNQSSLSASNKRSGAEADEKPKAKRGRKATKKTADGTAPPPKKKAMTKKKAAAAAAAAAAATTTPSNTQ